MMQNQPERDRSAHGVAGQKDLRQLEILNPGSRYFSISPDALQAPSFGFSVAGQVGRVNLVAAQPAELAGPGEVIPPCAVDQNQRPPMRIISLVSLVVDIIQVRHMIVL